MAIYEIETDDGKTYEIETEEPISTQTTQTPKTVMQVLGDAITGITTPLVSKEQILSNPISKSIAGAMPFTSLGGMIIPPPLGDIIPPNLKSDGNAEYISGETSPLSMIANVGILKGLQAQKQLPKLFNLGGRKTAQAIAESADRGFDAVGKVMSKKYDMLFDKIKEGTTSNSPIFEAMRNVVDSYPEAAGVPKLNKIMERLADVETISAKELHDMKQVVRKSIPKSVWSGTVEADAPQNAMRDVYFKITEALEKIGGKEYAGLSQEYKKVKEAEKLAKKMFYSKGIPSNLPLGEKLDIPTEKSIKTLDKMLPESEGFAKDFMAWRRGQAIKKAAAPIGGIGLAGYMAHRYLTDRLMGNR